MLIWNQFLMSKEKELGIETVNKWLKPLKVVNYDACNLYLEAKDSFQALWFEEHILPTAKFNLRNNNNTPIKVHLSVANFTLPNAANEVAKDTPFSNTFELTYEKIDTDNSFNTLIPYKGNLIPYKLLAELIGYDTVNDTYIDSKLPLAGINPIYIYGLNGTGKTHFLMATTQALRKKGINVLYTKAETFTDNMVRALRAGKMQEFRKAYRHADILIIDDIHIFARKSATQEEFFHTFNTLHVECKQIIISANRSPIELDSIESRLISRFEWGIVLPLQQPAENDLKNILVKKLQGLNFPLQNSVLEFLLKNFGNNPNRLYRSIKALTLRAHLKSTPYNTNSSKEIDIAFVKKLLHDFLEEQKKAILTSDKIIEVTASLYGIRVQDILGKSQSRDCVYPRQVAMYLCREKLSLPYMKIGHLFSRDHSTVMTSVKQIKKNLIRKDEQLMHALNSLHKKLSE